MPSHVFGHELNPQWQVLLSTIIVTEFRIGDKISFEEWFQGLGCGFWSKMEMGFHRQNTNFKKLLVVYFATHPTPIPDSS